MDQQMSFLRTRELRLQMKPKTNLKGKSVATQRKKMKRFNEEKRLRRNTQLGAYTCFELPVKALIRLI